MPLPNLDPARSALLVMDYQIPIVSRITDGQAVLLGSAAAAVAAARQAGVRVIYVVVGFRPGFPEISDRNPGFGALKAAGTLLSTEVHPDLAPRGEEVTVTKHRVSAFAGTDLDMILRANRIDTLILAGISTSGVVLSSLRHAADADYGLVVLADCCADPDSEVHACLIGKVFPRQASIATSAEFAAALAPGPGRA